MRQITTSTVVAAAATATATVGFVIKVTIIVYFALHKVVSHKIIMDENSTANHTITNAIKTTTGAVFDPAWHVLLTVQFYFSYAVITIGCVGTAANATVLYALMAHNVREAKKRVINLLIINQNLLDLFCCFLLVISVFIEINNIYLTGIFGYLLCSIIINGTATHCVLYGSIINLVALTIERYLKVVHAIWSKTHLKRWMIHAAMAFAWIGGIATAAPTSFITARLEEGRCISYYESQNTSMVFGGCTVVLFFFFPIFIFIYCYWRIVVVIRRQMRVMAGHNVEGSSQMTASQTQSKRVKWNIIKTMIVVTVAFVVCWLPINVLNLILMNSEQTIMLAIGYYITVFLVYFNICMNPFIYARKHDGVKQQLARLMVCHKPSDVTDTPGSNSNRDGGKQQTPIVVTRS